MRLLITTQVVDINDPDLGFFCRWIEEFAKKCERIEVICLYEGEHHLPENVTVHSLGKENAKENTGEKNRNDIMSSVRAYARMFASRIAYAIRFKLLAFNLRNDYDAVFVHMNPEYVILGSIFWKLWKKRIGLWYLHKSVDSKLRLAVMLTDVVFTASRESFRLHSPKVRIVGHGIALDEFPEPSPRPFAAHADGVRLVTVGRLSPSKKLDRILDALDVLVEKSIPFTFDSIGTTGRPEDRLYEEELQKHIDTTELKGKVHFLGAKPHAEIAKLLGNHDLFLHASTGTGSVDKAVLEALLCGVPVISTSEAFRDLLTPYGLSVREGVGKETGERLAAAVAEFIVRTDIDEVRTALREHVAREYSLETLVPRILATLQETEK